MNKKRKRITGDKVFDFCLILFFPHSQLSASILFTT